MILPQVNSSLRNGTCTLDDLNFRVEELQEKITEKCPFGVELTSVKVDRVEVNVHDYWKSKSPIFLRMGTVKVRCVLHAPLPEGS